MKWLKDKPACPGLVVDPEPVETPASKTTEKNRKKKEARKKAAEKKQTGDSMPCVHTDTDQLSERLGAVSVAEQSAPADISKRLKNLRKRLAQIDALKAKLDSGDLANPDPDQIRKIQRRDQVVDEIAELEMQL